jgi:hypothetical protein
MGEICGENVAVLLMMAVMCGYVFMSQLCITEQEMIHSTSLPFSDAFIGL